MAKCIFTWWLIGATIVYSYAHEADSLFRLHRETDPYDALFDFPQNIARTATGISVFTNFQGSGCSSRGVLKLTVSKDDLTKKRLLIDLFFDNPQGWVFDLGDSETNNGYAGDAMSQGRDAELQLYGSLTGYLSDFGPSGQAFNTPNPAKTRLTLLVGDEHVVWIADGDATKVNYYSNPGWFALRGQAESEGPINYDLYLATNGVVTMSPGRTGTGLCKVGIKYVPAI
ncbi:uncharacterized protein LOC106065512 [Biomphalaria glabrata]|uniref:Uncharacterized protein LOC106065512 n=1 Tax=Biomphalaria glabrata TaxID=6526 RepID=A0A9U8EAM5_BIOGL|nr:uncharacterized protein LOC106065512 [Biomphalaria glabrata]